MEVKIAFREDNGHNFSIIATPQQADKNGEYNFSFIATPQTPRMFVEDTREEFFDVMRSNRTNVSGKRNNGRKRKQGPSVIGRNRFGKVSSGRRN